MSETELLMSGEAAPGELQLESSSARLFELAPDRIEISLRLNSGGSRYELKHRLRPPRLADWCEYERNLKSTVEAPEHSPDALQFESASMEAAVALYDSLFLEAEGYCIATEDVGVTCGQIPAHHKEMVIRGLGDVAPELAEGAELSEEAGSPAEKPDVALYSLDSEHVSITLQALARGEKFSGLVHKFSPPTAAHRIQYSRIVSQALYVRGSRSLKTLLPARLPGLVKLYDQLICEAHGYCAQGSELADRAAIVRHMDPLHKKAAVQELFEG